MAAFTVFLPFLAILLCMIWCSSCHVLRFDISRKPLQDNTSDPCVRLQCSSQRQEKQVVLRYISLTVLEQPHGKPASKFVSVLLHHEPTVHKSYTSFKRVFSQGKVTSNRAELYVTIDATEKCENTTVYTCQLNFIDMQGKDQTIVAEKGQSKPTLLQDPSASESSMNSGFLLSALHNITDRLDTLELRLGAVESKVKPEDEAVTLPALASFKILPRVPVISFLGLPVLQNNLYGGGWVVFQRRVTGNVNFFRGWNDYKNGFGGLDGDFWLGNEHIHQLTSRGYNELRVDLSFGDKKAFALYSHFSVSGEADNYRLNVSGYVGTAGDSLGYHNGNQFSTFDVDNDGHGREHCAFSYKGAWWHGKCHKSNLNGMWNSTVPNKGPRWEGFTGVKPASSTEMMIRQK